MWLSDALDWWFERGLSVMVGAALGLATGVWMKLPPEPPPVAPAQGYVIRRGEFTIIDKRANPDKSINPSYMAPNMRFICTEEK